MNNDSLLIAEFLESEAKRKAKYLGKDSVFAFRTNDSRLGIFYVNDVNGNESGTVNVSIKVQDIQ